MNPSPPVIFRSEARIGAPLDQAAPSRAGRQVVSYPVPEPERIPGGEEVARQLFWQPL